MTQVDALAYILDGLADALALERELGVKSVECPREVLSRAARAVQTPIPQTVKPVSAKPAIVEPPAAKPAPVKPQPVPNTQPAKAPAPSVPSVKVVFLSDGSLTAEGEAMIKSIIEALHFTPEEAPVVSEKPIPRAKAYVALGSRTLRKFMPGKRGEPGQWIRSEGGKDVLVTYSPDYILRFQEVTPAVQKIKVGMWLSLKSLAKRVSAS